MSDEQAASFSLGSQTAMALIRRSGVLFSGGNVAVLSARSTTSLFVIRLLIQHGFIPTCFTTSEWSREEIENISPATVVRVTQENSLGDLFDSAFTHVIDPYCDMNILKATQILKTDGTYVTCGFVNQHPEMYTKMSAEKYGKEVLEALQICIIKNLQIIGNCLGDRDDLRRAVHLFEATRVGPLIDEVYAYNDVVKYLNRSFFDSSRLGKCVVRMPEIGK